VLFHHLVVDELGDCFGVPHEIGIGRVFGRIVNEKVKIIHRDANTSVQYALLLKSQFCETQIHELGGVRSGGSQSVVRFGDRAVSIEREVSDRTPFTTPYVLPLQL